MTGANGELAIRQAVAVLETVWGSGEVDAPYEQAAVQALAILRAELPNREHEELVVPATILNVDLGEQWTLVRLNAPAPGYHFTVPVLTVESSALRPGQAIELVLRRADH